jgi:hypothetical protein
MALQNFIAKIGPAVSAVWLNAVDVLKFTVFGDATTKEQARANLTSDAPMEVENGGTGVRTYEDLVAALGVVPGAGPTGPTGPTGLASTVAGPTGPTGAGVAGVTGPTGPTGPGVGATGPTGPTGAMGSSYVNYVVTPKSPGYLVTLEQSLHQHAVVAGRSDAGSLTINVDEADPWPSGSIIYLQNLVGTSNWTISITNGSNTIYLAGSSSSGTRTLAYRGAAILTKGITDWQIDGTGVS